MPGTLTSSQAALRRIAWVTAAVVPFVVASCGADRPGASGPHCPAFDEVTDDPVHVDLRWAGAYWDHSGVVALIDSWDDRTAGIEVEVHEPVLPADNVAALVEGTAPTLVRVPLEAVASLRGAGLIRPLPDCAETPTPQMDVGRIHDVGTTRWARAGNVAVVAMLYDRQAFERAELDPEQPPSTWDELEAAARQLRARAGILSPVAALWPGIIGLTDHEVDDRPPDGLRTIVRLWQDGLVLPPSQPEDLPPLGDGRAAIELVGEGTVWGYGSALAAGQAPEADLALAPVPGERGPVVPVMGTVWAISAAATDAEAAAAALLADWLAMDEQQAALHPLTDLLPSSPSASAATVVQRHWDDIPLFRELGALISQHGRIAGLWSMAPGALHALDSLSVGPAALPNVDQAWQRTRAAIDAARRPTTDHAALLACVYPNHQRSAPLTSCAG